MKLFFQTILTLIFITTNVFADLTIPPKSVEKQYLYNTPINVNSGFEQGLTGWTVSEASTMVLQTSLSHIHSGARSIGWNPSAAGTLTSETFTPNANLGGMLTVECYFKTADADYDLQLYDTTAAAVVQSMDIVTDGADSAFALNKFIYPMSPSGTTRTFQIRLNAPGNESVMYIDDCRMYFDASAVPVSVNQVYSAKISSADAVTHENVDWINGNCTDATAGEQTCTFTTGLFTQTPNCTATNSDVNSNNDITISAISATAITIFSAGNGTPSDRATILICQRSEPNSGFAVRMDQTNYDWTAYTPTFTGFGTVSTSECYHKRDGSDMLVKCKFTSDTPTATEARVSLPSTAAATPAAIWKCGDGAASPVAAQVFHTLCEPSVAYVTFGLANGGASGALTKRNGNTLLNAADVFAFNARLNISGWTENQSAPLIIGGVTSSYQGTLKIESATVDSSCGSTPCTITRQYGTGITSITRSSAGRYVAVIAAGTFSAAPICNVDSYSSVSINRICKLDAVTTTTAAGIACIDSTFGAQDSNFAITCTGPR